MPVLHNPGWSQISSRYDSASVHIALLPLPAWRLFCLWCLLLVSNVSLSLLARISTSSILCLIDLKSPMSIWSSWYLLAVYVIFFQSLISTFCLLYVISVSNIYFEFFNILFSLISIPRLRYLLLVSDNYFQSIISTSRLECLLAVFSLWYLLSVLSSFSLSVFRRENNKLEFQDI